MMYAITNMYQLEWDDNLANAAQNWVNTKAPGAYSTAVFTTESPV